MAQQSNKVQKRKRRKAYIVRKRDAAKAGAPTKAAVGAKAGKPAKAAAGAKAAKAD